MKELLGTLAIALMLTVGPALYIQARSTAPDPYENCKPGKSGANMPGCRDAVSMALTAGL